VTGHRDTSRKLTRKTDLDEKTVTIILSRSSQQNWCYGDEMPDRPDEIKTVEVDPSQEGWKRHPTLDRVWVLPDGKLYEFAPRQRQVLVIARWPLRL